MFKLRKGARIYLAGPMRGVPDLNVPIFKAAAADLRERGFSVYNPATYDSREAVAKGMTPEKATACYSFAWFMAKDLPHVCTADAVVVLAGWRKSQGARLEALVARECGIPVLSYPTLGEVAR